MHQSPPPTTTTTTTTTTFAFFPKDSRHHLPFLLLLSLLLLLLLLLHLHSSPSPAAATTTTTTTTTSASTTTTSASFPSPPTFAYLLTGSAGDSSRLLRLLLAAYHPANHYLLLLERAAGDAERARLARAAQAAVPRARNVHVVGSPGFANQRGASALAAALHGAAVLLRVAPEFDWFVNLDAADYPLVTQDDLLHVFSYLPRDLNFIQHTSYIGWKESRQIRPIVVDPGLYLSSRTDIFYATQKRDLPNAYRLFTGSSSVILSRKFIEYCILGTDNLPRNLLMYYTNVPSPHVNYFQTVLCNSPEFNRTVINHDLHYGASDIPPKKKPRTLSLDDVGNMSQSGAAFGSKFSKDDLVLDRIDEEILHRLPKKTVPGGWCIGGEHGNPCAVVGNPDVLIPGPRAMKLAKFLVERLSYQNFYSNQCIWD